MERSIPGPDRDLLTAAEAAAWLGIGETVFRALVRKGAVPPGIPIGDKALRWHWLDVVAYAHLQARKR